MKTQKRKMILMLFACLLFIGTFGIMQVNNTTADVGTYLARKLGGGTGIQAASSGAAGFLAGYGGAVLGEYLGSLIGSAGGPIGFVIGGTIGSAVGGW